MAACSPTAPGLLREVIEDTKDAIGDTCAVAVRITIDEMSGPDGICAEAEGRDIIASLAELPDAWDVKVSGWSNDSETSRFKQEGYQEPYACYIKQVTTKPVIGTGRFTSPDTMVSQVRRGILDIIGCARPSIADPFLPKKDRGRAARRHPRVHRVQHLCLHLQPRRADQLHAEPDDR